MESLKITPKIELPYLPEGRTILYVPENNPYMLAAKEVAMNESTDRKTSTGVVVVNNEGNIVASAANKSALKNKFLLNTHKNWCVRRICKIPSGQKYWMCPGCAAPKNHAESHTMRKAKKAGVDLTGSDVYLWGHWWACKDCWDSMIKAGIKNVYLMEGTENGYNNSNPAIKK